jgi:hypothetical protein
MADEARAMLDALMGADRNAPVEGASGVNNSSGGGGAPRGRKKSCYDHDVCPLYCAWSLSSQENPTWAETVAANEGAGGIDVFDLFTNTKSDIGGLQFAIKFALSLMIVLNYSLSLSLLTIFVFNQQG